MAASSRQSTDGGWKLSLRGLNMSVNARWLKCCKKVNLSCRGNDPS